MDELIENFANEISAAALSITESEKHFILCAAMALKNAAFQQGRIAGLYAARNSINENFNL